MDLFPSLQADKNDWKGKNKMPRLPRDSEEIEKIRDEILDCALEIIGDEGYDSLSMRKIGDSYGCAAKTIYNYYSCKEEIYLRVLTRGFEELNRQAKAAISGIKQPQERLRILSDVYVHFGTENSNYYNIMFNWDVPKYTDYIDTALEPVAREEKDTAFIFAAMAEDAIAETLQKTGKLSEGEVTFHLLRLWSGLHGIVSLHNSHGIQEYNMDPEHYIERIKDALLSEFT